MGKLVNKNYQKEASTRWIYILVLLVSMAVFLSACQNQPNSNQTMPRWVTDDFLRDFGEFNWVYENGLFYGEPVVTEQDGVTLTIWGESASPYRAGVFYSIEGLVYEPEFGGILITAVNGEKLKLPGGGYYGSGPDGYAGTAMTDILTTASEGEQSLTIVLPQVGDLSSDIVIDLTVKPDRFRDLYQVKKVNYVNTIAGVTIKFDRIIYSPEEI
ncbi:MAG: hypothetical protein NUK65_13730, partial [Firmicutes bacterium]|nr:hypothetical protein [Bacillota bacterium]